MNGLRILLVILWLIVTGYTLVTVAGHGINFFPAYFADLAKMGWPGQFDIDFSSYLVLAAVWIAWRHQFSAGGILLGIFSPMGGMVFLAMYLLVIVGKEKADIATLLLGNARVAAFKSD